jgi:hypothetical protein
MTVSQSQQCFTHKYKKYRFLFQRQAYFCGGSVELSQNETGIALSQAVFHILVKGNPVLGSKIFDQQKMFKNQPRTTACNQLAVVSIIFETVFLFQCFSSAVKKQSKILKIQFLGVCIYFSFVSTVWVLLFFFSSKAQWA